LDEAYFEYVDWPQYPNGMDYFRKMPNLVVLRTFSKIYGLAGVRLGYGIMHSQLTGYLHRTRMPFNISSLAQAGGIAALDDLEHVRSARETAIRGLQYLEHELPALGLKVPQSHANFVFAEFGRSAKPIYEQLLRKGIITRPLPSYGFPNALRISVGLASQNERLVAALKQVL
jgi:histidinol-phosphate aminotransferase